MLADLSRLIQQDRKPLLTLGITIIALISVFALLAGNWLLAGASAWIGAMLWLAKTRLETGDLRDSPIGRLIVLSVLVIAATGSLAGNTGLMIWWLFLPPLLNALFPFRLGVVLTVAVLFIAWLLNFFAAPTTVRHQVIPGLLLIGGIVLTLASLRHIRERQLRPLRRTDTLTQASTREHLEVDLAIEILRSEREGTDLSLVALCADQNMLEALPSSDQKTVVAKIGRLLHAELRIFEAYYRMGDAGFVILLPHADTPTAIKTAGRLRQKIRRAFREMEMEVTASAGVAGLNVGEDAETLLRHANEALALACRRGNRTHAHSAGNESGADIDE